MSPRAVAPIVRWDVYPPSLVLSAPPTCAPPGSPICNLLSPIMHLPMRLKPQFRGPVLTNVSRTGQTLRTNKGMTSPAVEAENMSWFVWLGHQTVPRSSRMPTGRVRIPSGPDPAVHRETKLLFRCSGFSQRQKTCRSFIQIYANLNDFQAA